MRLLNVFLQPGVVVQEATLQEGGEPPYPEEVRMATGCVEKRRREIAASRICARRALAGLGIEDFPVLARSDRSPIWPAGVVGSITHTDGGKHGYCGVAVADRRVALGLGIDAEPNQPLPGEIWPMVLDEAEQEAVLRCDEPGKRARLIFSAKEATYKALYQVTGQFLDFSDVHVDVLPSQSVFLARLIGERNSPGSPLGVLPGRFVTDEELVVTGVHLCPVGQPLARPQEGLSKRAVPC